MKEFFFLQLYLITLSFPSHLIKLFFLNTHFILLPYSHFSHFPSHLIKLLFFFILNSHFTSCDEKIELLECMQRKEIEFANTIRPTGTPHPAPSVPSASPSSDQPLPATSDLRKRQTCCCWSQPAAPLSLPIRDSTASFQVNTGQHPR